MKRNKFLAGLLCGCLIAGSIPVNTYATASAEGNSSIILPTDELSENSGGVTLMMKQLLKKRLLIKQNQSRSL